MKEGGTCTLHILKYTCTYGRILCIVVLLPVNLYQFYHTHTLFSFLSLSLSLSLSLTHTHTHSLSLSLSLSHTHTHCFSSITYTHSLFLSLCLSLLHTHCFTNHIIPYMVTPHRQHLKTQLYNLDLPSLP